jgi:hypothetical protein
VSEHDFKGAGHDDPGETAPPVSPAVPGRPDPRSRPDDPAGTKPKVDAESLLPAVREPLLTPPAPPSDHDAAELLDPADDNELLPGRPTSGPAADSAYTPRFQFLLGALFALGLAALAAVVAIAVQGKPARAPEQPWSSWKPTGKNAPGEIAQHVGREYKQQTGEQLVLVTGGPLAAGNTPLKIVVDEKGNYSQVGGTGVLYQLCGLGDKCHIPSGKPSEERGTLLRREILELALYTFRYTDADNVVAIMPPGVKKNGKPKARQDQAVFLQRGDVGDELARPLSTTLTTRPPSIRSVMTAPDIASVRALITQRSFAFRVLSGGTDGAYIVLQPLF